MIISSTTPGGKWGELGERGVSGEVPVINRLKSRPNLTNTIVQHRS